MYHTHLPGDVVDANDWVDFLDELLDMNPELKNIYDRFETVCSDQYQRLLKAGVKEEDAREILYHVNWLHEIQVTTVQIVGGFLEKRHMAIRSRIEVPEEPTAGQKQYLKLLQQKYHASLGCQPGSEDFPEK